MRSAWCIVRLPAVALVGLLQVPVVAQAPGETLWHHRNLGKAFYENPTTRAEAVEEFRQALALAPDSARERVNYGLALLRAGRTAEGVTELERAKQQDPALPHTWFNLGIVFKRESQYERAVREFEQMVKLVPGDAVSHYNLGYVYKLTGRPAEALAAFERAAALDPNMAGPRFQLYNAYRDLGRSDDAARELKTFQDLRRRQTGAAVPEDLDWGYYSEIYDPADTTMSADTSEPAALSFARQQSDDVADPARSGLLVLDHEPDGQPDLLVWAGRRLQVRRQAGARLASADVEAPGLVRTVASGDFDNDGRTDLAVVTDAGVALYANRSGRFEVSPLPDLPDGLVSAVWIDYDHDYDLDLLLAGRAGVLLRNNGAAGFSDQTADFPFVPGRALAAAGLQVTPDTLGRDIVVGYADRGGVLYTDRLGGRFEPVPLDVVPAGASAFLSGDIDHDGTVDLVVTGPDGASRLLRNLATGWTAVPLGAAAALALGDLENRGFDDLIGPGGVLRNAGLGHFEPRAIEVLSGARAAAAADFDGDGRIDLARLGPDGTLDVLRNTTETEHHWIRVGLEGVRNPKLAFDAVVEVKAGALYQRRTYTGVPLVFGLRDQAEADAVRITWPNGLIQNEVRQAAGRAVAYKEAQRLSGSCPMIFTWDGEQYRFITDVLGVAPLGASAGDGTFFPVDHDEYVQITGDALTERDGRFLLRVTEELREVSYLDEVRLLAVDHPAGIELFTNDKFKAPPFPDFRLFGVERRVHPIGARDHRGGDVRSTLLATDRVYADGFERTYAGVAELHTIELDFGREAAPDNAAILVLNGWVDWADGSTFLGQAQERPGGLVMPRLQVRDARGRWVTVVEDMGIPAGKPKTIVVDLTGKFPSASRELRIVTSLCVYWDEIFLGERAAAPEAVLTPLPMVEANLGFRGFSTPVIHPERRQPEAFDYGRLMPLSMWNPTPGLYTRYGSVGSLLEMIDDRMVVMGAGDELTLAFDARAVPASRPGWTRQYLLKVDGWAKDGDANTAFGQSVEPLPFHGMTGYPYPPGESFPSDRAHEDYRREYNTRPALRLLRPLTAAGPGEATRSPR